jgi:hypothetical protein
MKVKYYSIILYYLPSILFLIISTLHNFGFWAVLAAIGWAIFISGLIIAFKQSSKNNGKQKKINDMKWTYKRNVNWLELHYTNQFERIVPTNKGTPISVMPKGAFRVGLLKDYDELVLVNLRPMQIKVDFTGNSNIITQDGVKLVGIISIKASIRDNNDSILKLVSNEIEEDELLYSYLKIAIKTIVSQYKWIELSRLNSDTLLQIKDFLSNTLINIDSCFKVDEVIEINLSPEDREFVELLERKQKEIENTKLKIEKLQAEEKSQEIIFGIEKKKIEKEFENKSITQKKEIELDEKLHQIEIVRRKEADQLEIEHKKAIADLEKSIFLDRINLLKDNNEALLILNPSLFEKIKLAEIEAQKEKEIRIQKAQENLTKLIFDAQNARRAGIVDVISQIPIVQESIGMNIKQIISSSDESEIKEELEKLKKENEELKSGKKNEDT